MIAQKITYNVLVSGIAKVISIILALFVIGMLTRYLGTEGFGKYSTVLAFFALFTALGDFGLYSIGTREISRDNAKEEWILSRVFTLRVLIACAIFILLTGGVWFLPYENDVRVSILVIGAAFVFSSSYGFLTGLFQKYIAMDRVAFVEFSGKLIQLGTVLLVMYFHLPLVFAAGAILCAMAWNFVLLFFLSRTYVTITPTVDKTYWKSFLKESLPMGVTAIITFLYFKVDTILLSMFQSQSDVGIYGVAYKIIENFMFFPSMMIGLIFPLFAKYIFTNTEKFVTIAHIMVKIFTMIIIPLVVTVYFLAPDIIRIVSGDGFDASIHVLRTVIFSLPFMFYGSIFTNILIAGGLQKKLMYTLLFAAIINITVNIILIPLYSYNGAAITSVITESFVALGTITLALRYTPFKIFFAQLPFIMCAGAAMVVACAILPFHMFLNAGIAVVIYAGLLFAFRVITRDDILHIQPKRS